ncbi:hypothetical protein OAO92_09820, partial [Paracoccaceae bacterium]|nr:hypothetical protein [Paracoccaceae bacterium]
LSLSLPLICKTSDHHSSPPSRDWIYGSFDVIHVVKVSWKVIMKKLALIILYIMVAGAVSAAGVENIVLEAEPIVEQANVSSEQKNVFLQLISILAAWFLLL